MAAGPSPSSRTASIHDIWLRQPIADPAERQQLHRNLCDHAAPGRKRYDQGHVLRRHQLRDQQRHAQRRTNGQFRRHHDDRQQFVNPPAFGQLVTFTATVDPSDGGGTVDFFADGSYGDLRLPSPVAEPGQRQHLPGHLRHIDALELPVIQSARPTPVTVALPRLPVP